MKIGIDVLGGDFAPDVNIDGASLALQELSQDVKIVLIGDQEQIESSLSRFNLDSSRIEIVHAPDLITMHDHPTRAIPQKPNSSISVGSDLLHWSDSIHMKIYYVSEYSRMDLDS